MVKKEHARPEIPQDVHDLLSTLIETVNKKEVSVHIQVDGEKPTLQQIVVTSTTTLENLRSKINVQFGFGFDFKFLKHFGYV